jgi:hypothetical protein
LPICDVSYSEIVVFVILPFLGDLKGDFLIIFLVELFLVAESSLLELVGEIDPLNLLRYWASY